MGQGNSQRRAQYQDARDVELWELYDENRNRRGHVRNGMESDRQNHRESRQYRAAGTTASGNRARRADNSGRRPIKVQEQERRYSGPSAGKAVDRSRRENRTGRRPESGNMGQKHRASRPKDISQISYIQPYSSTGNRRKNPEYVYRGNARPVQSIRRRRARRRKELLSKAVIMLLAVFCLVMIYFITGQIYQMVHKNKIGKEKETLPVMTEQTFDDDMKVAPPELTEDLLEINEYSRPGTPLEKIRSIFVHYTANPGTSAAQNRSYFANLAQTHERSASAHLIIGYEGELIQCIPFDEQAYAVMTRNEDSISIECCYLSDDGAFTQETYDTLIHTLAWLVEQFHLSTEDILRHYDCGGKLCPLYYAEHEDEWEQLKEDVAAYMAGE